MRTLLILSWVVVGVVSVLTPIAVTAEEKFRVCWSHYTGWEPWEFARHKGILDRWAAKEGISIQLDRVNDYIESINLYTSGTYDACTMTNMDALTIPAVGGVDSTALIIGDFSDGNDGIVMKGGTTVADLKGRKINLVELSVSHYLLSRALSMNNLTEREVSLVNTSDADIGSVFVSSENGAAVTWNPILMQARNSKGATLVFDSSKIPGEIIDLMVVKTAASEKLKRALVGAWYETMAILKNGGKEADEAIDFMAKNSGGTPAEFRAQLKTTRMFFTPSEAVAFAQSADLKRTMEYVRSFSFDHGLFGDGARDKNVVGIEFSDRSVIGDSKNVKLRFPSNWMEGAESGARS
jgi:NitT/TauT family transport system substrate-binding protein